METWFTWAHLIDAVLLIAGFIIGFMYGRDILRVLVLEPIQGEDGKTSMPELAQYVLVLILAYMVFKEATSEAELFSAEKFFTIAGAVAAIGGINIWKRNNGKTG